MQQWITTWSLLLTVDSWTSGSEDASSISNALITFSPTRFTWCTANTPSSTYYRVSILEQEFHCPAFFFRYQPPVARLISLYFDSWKPKSRWLWRKCPNVHHYRPFRSSQFLRLRMREHGEMIVQMIKTRNKIGASNGHGNRSRA